MIWIRKAIDSPTGKKCTKVRKEILTRIILDTTKKVKFYSEIWRATKKKTIVR